MLDFVYEQKIVDWLAASFKRDEGIDLLKDKQALQRLAETAEKAKMELSSLTQAGIRWVWTYVLLCFFYVLPRLQSVVFVKLTADL